jgi:hypothetical protein
MQTEILIKQRFLEAISEVRDIQVSKLKKDLNISLNVAYSYCEEIFADGYIAFSDTTTKDGKDARVRINGKGEIFISQGGYVQIESNDIKNQTKGRIKGTLSTFSTIVAIIAGISTITLGYLTFRQNQNIQEIKDYTEYDYTKKLKKELIGKWKFKHSTESDFYIFKDDNTWEHYYYDSGKKITYKGEFQLGPNNGVFLRKFGSQHWFHDTTYVDIQSGIGTSYYYLEDKMLINNQEDYETRYIKVE